MVACVLWSRVFGDYKRFRAFGGFVQRGAVTHHRTQDLLLVYFELSEDTLEDQQEELGDQNRDYDLHICTLK